MQCAWGKSSSILGFVLLITNPRHLWYAFEWDHEYCLVGYDLQRGRYGIVEEKSTQAKEHTQEKQSKE